MTKMNTEARPVPIEIVLLALGDILDTLQRQRTDRETALAITKLQECIMWLNEGQRNAVSRT